MQHMIDLETFATDNNAQIISIGIACFTSERVAFSKNYIVDPSVEHGFSCNPQTVLFWLKQDKIVQEELYKDSAKDLKLVLEEVAELLKGTKGVWGNGSTFDNTILRNAYNKLGIKCPWHFREDRDYRTLSKLFKIKFDRLGDLHNSEDDAVSQATHLIKICHKFNIVLQ